MSPPSALQLGQHHNSGHLGTNCPVSRQPFRLLICRPCLAWSRNSHTSIKDNAGRSRVICQGKLARRLPSSFLPVVTCTYNTVKMEESSSEESNNRNDCEPSQKRGTKDLRTRKVKTRRLKKRKICHKNSRCFIRLSEKRLQFSSLCVWSPAEMSFKFQIHPRPANQLKTNIYIFNQSIKKIGGGDSSVVRAPDS